MNDGARVDQSPPVELSPFHHRAVKRLFPALFLLRVRRDPYPWELRLGEAIIYGELVADRPPRDAGLRQIHHVAEDVKLALNFTRELLGNDAG